MMRLSNTTLNQLPADVRRPAYARDDITTGIVHLGIGAFHRAHQAVMTEAVLAEGDHRWGIVAASLRSGETRDALGPQDGLYTVAAGSGLHDTGPVQSLQVIGAIQRIHVAPEDPEALIAAMSAPSVMIITLTVTEKGYCHDPATGTLNEQHPDIVHDLAHPLAPRSAPGFVLAALARRRVRGIAPFAVLSCDNLPSNGRVVARVLARMAELTDRSLATHIEQAVSCPCTMVDRIVPATTDDDKAHIATKLGVRDAWPVMTEPFSQWVIEDRFPQGRPAWDRAGAQFVRDVAPFEVMKLRLLNGAHSSLAYLGLNVGHETVADAANDPRLSRFLAGLWAEIRPTVFTPEGVDLGRYCDDLLLRFRNTSIRHRLAQIAMDGSQKLPQRLLAPWRDNMAAGRDSPHIALAVAAFVAHVGGRAPDGRIHTVQDPRAAELAALSTDWRENPTEVARRLMTLHGFAASDMIGNPAFARSLAEALERLASKESA